MATRLGLAVFVVSNGSRPIRPPENPLVTMITVSEGADIADDWIAERIGAGDICVTSDIPLAGRCLAAGGRAISPKGHHWTPDNIGSALAGRAIGNFLRETGVATGGPSPLTKADRSKFMQALDSAIHQKAR